MHQIGKIKKLIDLNGESVNFEINFRIACKNPFEMLVVDQTTLDNSPKLEYKLVNTGEISGTVKNDKNVYQNYFLVLKAENDSECFVEIDKKELPKNSNISLPENNKNLEEQKMGEIAKQSLNKSSSNSNSLSWGKIILILFGIIIICSLCYYFFFRKKSPSSEFQENFSKGDVAPIIAPVSPAKIVSNNNKSILDRLKKIEI